MVIALGAVVWTGRDFWPATVPPDALAMKQAFLGPAAPDVAASPTVPVAPGVLGEPDAD